MQAAITFGFVGRMISANTAGRSGINVARASEQRITFSASFLDEISVSSSRQLFIFLIFKKNLDECIQKHIFLFILKMEALINLPEWHHRSVYQC